MALVDVLRSCCGSCESKSLALAAALRVRAALAGAAAQGRRTAAPRCACPARRVQRAQRLLNGCRIRAQRCGGRREAEQAAVQAPARRRRAGARRQHRGRARRRPLRPPSAAPSFRCTHLRASASSPQAAVISRQAGSSATPAPVPAWASLLSVIASPSTAPWVPEGTACPAASCPLKPSVHQTSPGAPPPGSRPNLASWRPAGAAGAAGAAVVGGLHSAAAHPSLHYSTIISTLVRLAWPASAPSEEQT